MATECAHRYAVNIDHPKPCTSCGELTRKTETYKCQRPACMKVFRDYPGPTTCAHCDHLYVTWLTYKEKP